MNLLTKLRLSLPEALLCLLTLSAAAQTTRNVGPGQPYTTIQSGIDAAVNGDTVLVAPGTYHEHIDFKGKAITVTSSGGAANTVIDGDNQGGKATVWIHSGETAATVLSQLTIRGGGEELVTTPNIGFGGVFALNASPVIRDNIITANFCHNVTVDSGYAKLLNNTISNVLQDNTYSQGVSSCAPFRSAIYLGGTPSTAGRNIVQGNLIENNLTGSGILLWAAQNVLIQGNTIRGNNSFVPGGALLTANSKGTIVVNNLIYGNSSYCGALGFSESGTDTSNPAILIANNTIVDNVVTTNRPTSNCSPAISQLYPSPFGSGSFSGPGAILIDNIISGASNYPSVDCDELSSQPAENKQPAFQSNILFNSSGPFFGPHCVDVSTKYNNIVADPQFVNPAANDYHLKSTSPAIDKGANSALDLYKQMTGTTLTTDIEGDPRIQDATGNGCIVDIGAYEATGSNSICSLTETLTGSPNPSNYGQTVTFTATLASGSGTPTGSVQFSDGTTQLGTSLVSGTGTATYSTSALSAGSHTITATYLPTGTFPSATKSITQVVNGYTTNLALTCAPPTILARSAPANLNATVTSPSGTPTGSVSFTDNGTPLSSVALNNGSATLSYVGPSVGTHTITATFVGTGAYNSGTSASCTENVTGQPSTAALTVSPIVNTYGSTVTLKATVAPGFSPKPGAPVGNVTFLNNGSSLGTASVANGVATFTTSALPGGTDNLSCRYEGDTVYAPSNCNTLSLVVLGAATSTILAATPNPSYFGQTVTLPVTVSSVSVSAGNVTLYDGGSALNTQALDATGRTTFQVTGLAVGTHALSTRFNSANASFLASTSGTVNEVVVASGFTLTLAPTTLTVKAGSTGSTTVTLGSLGVFNSPLTLTYRSLPTNASATFAAVTLIPPTGGAASTTFTVNTQGPFPKSASSRPRLPWQGTSAVLATLALGALPFTRGRRTARLLGLALFAAAMGTITGCKDIYIVAPLVSPGTYTVPIIATDPSGNTATANLNLVVTP